MSIGRHRARDIDIHMKRKELTKTFMMISNLKNIFAVHSLYKNYQRCDSV